MTPRLTLLTWLLVLGSLVTGLGQVWMRYFVDPVDEFSAWNHPWQGTVESLHVFLAPLLVLGLGYVLSAHAGVKWNFPGTSPGRKRSGGALIGLIASLVLSGAWLAAWSFPDGDSIHWIHGISGGLFGLLFLGHAISRKRL
jgi:hypothetical protein